MMQRPSDLNSPWRQSLCAKGRIVYDLGSVSVQNDTFTMPSFSLLEPPQPQGIRDTLYLQAPPGSATALALAQVASSAPLLSDSGTI